jgi:hypothetical protein
MGSAVSAQGIRPYAPSTRQTVCIVVTPSSENGIFCFLCFQSLTHSFAGVFSTTPLQSYSSALFAKNTGGGYTPHNPPLVFKGLRALQNVIWGGIYPRSAEVRPSQGILLSSSAEACISLQFLGRCVFTSLFRSFVCSSRLGVPLRTLCRSAGGAAGESQTDIMGEGRLANTLSGAAWGVYT